MGALKNLEIAIAYRSDPDIFRWIEAVSALLDGESPDGVSTFATLATGSAGSGRLIDVTADAIASLKNGSAVWVSSVGDVFRWDVASALTADNITIVNPTANGANPGRFIRALLGNPASRQQASWFVSTGGIDEASGLTALAPLRTDAEIQRRWGPSPQIATAVTVTYVDSPTTQTNFDLQLLTDGSFKLLGTAANVLTGAISAVTTQNRATQTPWDVTGVGLGAAHVGSIIEITASATPANVGAYAVVLKDLTGGKVRVSPFGTASVNIGAPFAAVTPGVGDTFAVRSMPTLSVGTVTIRNGTGIAPAAGPPVKQAAVIDLLNLNGGAVGTGTIEASGVNVFLFRVLSMAMRWTGVARGASNITAAGGGVKTTSCLVADSQTFNAFSMGLLAGLGATAGSTLLLKQDCYFQATTPSFSAGVRITSSGTAYFDASAVALTIVPGCVYGQGGAVPDWGTANGTFGIRVQSTGSYVYQTKPTINATLGAGRETVIGGTDKQYGAVPFIEPANSAAIFLLA